jgi:hypothetical protein
MVYGDTIFSPDPDPYQYLVLRERYEHKFEPAPLPTPRQISHPRKSDTKPLPKYYQNELRLFFFSRTEIGARIKNELKQHPYHAADFFDRLGLWIRKQPHPDPRMEQIDVPNRMVQCLVHCMNNFPVALMQYLKSLLQSPDHDLARC